MNYIIAIDPGNQQSAFCIMDGDTLKPLRFAKLDNEPMFCEMVEGIADLCCVPDNTVFAIEWIKSYGNAVGDSVFDTCAWIGRLEERLKDYKVTRIIRAWEKTQICHSSKAGDSNIRRALIDRFAKDVRNDGKGTKAEPGWFYGFRKDVWQAYAVGVTYHDMFYEGTLPEGEYNK